MGRNGEHRSFPEKCVVSTISKNTISQAIGQELFTDCLKSMVSICGSAPA